VHSNTSPVSTVTTHNTTLYKGLLYRSFSYLTSSELYLTARARTSFITLGNHSRPIFILLVCRAMQGKWSPQDKSQSYDCLHTNRILVKSEKKSPYFYGAQRFISNLSVSLSHMNPVHSFAAYVFVSWI